VRKLGRARLSDLGGFLEAWGRGSAAVWAAAMALCWAAACDSNGRLTPVRGVPIEDHLDPPVNRFLADSPWPMSHRNPYCQASSPYPGPTGPATAGKVDFLDGSPGLITVAMSGAYPDGSRVLWGSNQTHVFKADAGEGGGYHDRAAKEDADLFNIDAALSGAYTLVDRENIFFVPRFQKITAYVDTLPGDPRSPIGVRGTFEIPEKQRHGEDDLIVGLSMTYDGMLALATRNGTVGVVSRTLDESHFLYLGEEEISNSIACDEENGIYVVTSRRMVRAQWTGSTLTIDPAQGGWVCEYETGEDGTGIRLGAGSGATPTLMGRGGDPDRFVVITDGQDLMHIVLFWRDEIPADWVRIPGTRDRRIAAQVPVRFGDPLATKSLSEQSVCVRGYGALVVNNQLRLPVDSRILALLLSGDPAIAPYGAEKFQWDPEARELRSAWVNGRVSLPNGIPCMSAATNLVYDIGQRAGIWTLEALDWDTGESVFHREVGPDLKFNSAYAATEVGLFGSLCTGTLTGMERFHP
jgi:hypothetical protein